MATTTSPVEFVVGDESPSIFGTLTDTSGNPYDLTDVTVRFQMRLAIDRRWAVDGAAATVGDPTAGQVRYDWQAGDLSAAGAYQSRWQLTFLSGDVEHTDPPNTITISPT